MTATRLNPEYTNVKYKTVTLTTSQNGNFGLGLDVDHHFVLAAYCTHMDSAVLVPYRFSSTGVWGVHAVYDLKTYQAIGGVQLTVVAAYIDL